MMESGASDRTETREARERQAGLTNAPITEEERAADRDRAGAERRPFPWAVGLGFAALAVLAVVVGATAGWAYAIPVLVLAAVAAVFIGAHRAMGLAQSRRHGGGGAREAAADDAGDPVPHMGFDEQSQLGSTAQLSDEDQAASHADMERASGER
jgi:hypothetical protein